MYVTEMTEMPEIVQLLLSYYAFKHNIFSTEDVQFSSVISYSRRARHERAH